jgi:hypothetical protein
LRSARSTSKIGNFDEIYPAELRNFVRVNQGCQIFIYLIYQNGGKIYQTATKLPNGRKIYQMAIEYTNFFIPRPFKIYPNLNFRFENIPSGNPGVNLNSVIQVHFAETNVFNRGNFWNVFFPLCMYAI